MNRFLSLNYYKLFGSRQKKIGENHKDKLLSRLKINDAIGFDHSYKEIFEDRVYSLKFSSDHPVILDCGSNIGLSIIYFKQQYPEAIIYGFEPDVNIYEILLANVNNFNLKNVEIINSAVWTKKGFIEFNPEGSLAGSIVTKNSTEFNSYKVSTINLRDYVENSKIDFLKLDIEGAEYEVLNSISDLLMNVENLFVEYHSIFGQEQKLGDILQIIKNAGFRYYIQNSIFDSPSPFTQVKKSGFDLQLNIFCLR